MKAKGRVGVAWLPSERKPEPVRGEPKRDERGRGVKPPCIGEVRVYSQKRRGVAKYVLIPTITLEAPYEEGIVVTFDDGVITLRRTE